MSHFTSKSCFLSLIAGALCATGCYSVNMADIPAGYCCRMADGSIPDKHVVVSNYGWYLFNSIPLATGNINTNGIAPWIFFSDTVQFELLQKELVAIARQRGAQIHAMNLVRDESIFFDIPGTQITMPIPYVLCYHENQISATLVKETAKPGDDRARDVSKLLDALNDGERRK